MHATAGYCSLSGARDFRFLCRQCCCLLFSVLDATGIEEIAALGGNATNGDCTTGSIFVSCGAGLFPAFLYSMEGIVFESNALFCFLYAGIVGHPCDGLLCGHSGMECHVLRNQRSFYNIHDLSDAPHPTVSGRRRVI